MKNGKKYKKANNVWVCGFCNYSCTKEKLKFLVMSRPCQLEPTASPLVSYVGQESQILFPCPDCGEENIYISAEWDKIAETYWFCKYCEHSGIKKELRFLLPCSSPKEIMKEQKQLYVRVQCPACGKPIFIDERYWDALSE